MRAFHYSPPCPGSTYRPPLSEIRDDGRALCPRCAQWVKVARESNWHRNKVGELHRHGFYIRRWEPAEEMTEQQARVMLRGAQLEFAQVNPRWLAAVEMRGLAAWKAARAGVTDGEIAEVYGVPKSNVARMRVRVDAKMAKAADDAR